MSIPEFIPPSDEAAPRRAERLRALRRVDRCVSRGDYAAAIRALEGVARDGADTYACRLRIAGLYRAMHALPLALEAAEEAAALAPDRLDAHEFVMALCLETGDYDRAVGACEAVLARSPRHLLAYSALGAAHIRRGDADAALRAFSALTRLDPHTASHHFKRGLLHQHRGEVALAVQEFEAAARLDGDGPHGLAARDALETLDSFQFNTIFTLAMEDPEFRALLERDAAEAASARGFALSEAGSALLSEIAAQALPELPEPPLALRYN